MARQFKNEKGFLIIEMNEDEARLLNFGTPEGCICTRCNDIIRDKIYYVAVLNDVMDKGCLKEWLHDAIRYEEDMYYEKMYYDLYAKHLGIDE